MIEVTHFAFVCKYVSFLLLLQTLIVLKFEFMLSFCFDDCARKLQLSIQNSVQRMMTERVNEELTTAVNTTTGKQDY